METILITNQSDFRGSPPTNLKGEMKMFGNADHNLKGEMKMKKLIFIISLIAISASGSDITNCGMYIKEVQERKLNGQTISELDSEIYNTGIVVMYVELPEVQAKKFLKSCLIGRQLFLKKLGRITEGDYHSAMADIEMRY